MINICIEIFFVRGSKMIGREHYFYTDLKERALTRHMSTKKAFKDSDNERGNKL